MTERDDGQRIQTAMTEYGWYKMALRYLIISAAAALIGAVYECFSHEVYSYYMIYAFAFPLVLGAIPSLLLLKRARSCRIPHICSQMWQLGILTMTVGSLLQGVLEIYGTTNRLIILYLIVGSVLMLGSVTLRRFCRE